MNRIKQSDLANEIIEQEKDETLSKIHSINALWVDVNLFSVEQLERLTRAEELRYQLIQNYQELTDAQIRNADGFS